MTILAVGAHPPDDLYHPDHNTTGKIVNDTGLMGTIPNIKTDSWLPLEENQPIWPRHQSAPWLCFQFW